MSKASGFRAVIFDYGNTLVASASLAKSLQAIWPDPIAFRIGQEIESSITALYSAEQRDQPDWRTLWGQAYAKHGAYYSEESAKSHLREFLRQSIVYPYTQPLLRRLRAEGLKLALLSNATGPSEIFHEDLEAKGLTEQFDVLAWSCEIGRRKPSAESFAFVLDQLGLSPKEVLMVGDNEVADILGGMNVGLATARIVDSMGEKTQANYKIDRVNIEDQLIDAIKTQLD